MKKKAIIAIVSLIVFGQGVWAWGGSGTQGDPYQIKTIDDLNTLATNVNNGNDYSGVYFKLTANLDYSGETLTDGSNFTPIGYGDRLDGVPFAGTFDGQGNVISGINYSDPEGTSIGLFGYISGALIQNVKMDHCSFTGNLDVGAIAGLASGVHDDSNHGIYNCIVGSHVTVEAVSITIESDEEPETYVDVPGTFAGGVVGECANTTLSGCVSAATVTGDDCVGGIAGRLISSVIGGKERGVIENCLFMGSVTGTTNKGDIVGARGAIEGEDGTEGLLQLALLDNDTEAVIDNATWLSCYNGAEGVDVTLSGRTLYRDGGWNTICLPFNVSAEQMAATTHPLYGATIKKLDTTSSVQYGENEYHTTGIEGDCLYLNFAEATSIVAGVPYIIKWGIASDHPGTNITNPVFTNVTINANASTEVSFTGGGKFVGTYNAKRFTTADLGQYLIMGGDNTLYYTKAGAGIGACRAYFQVPEGSASIKMFNLNFSDYSTTTKITNTNLADQTYEDGEWWTLSGMKLNGKPSEKGVYLFNGKKVVIQ